MVASLNLDPKAEARPRDFGGAWSNSAEASAASIIDGCNPHRLARKSICWCPLRRLSGSGGPRASVDEAIGLLRRRAARPQQSLSCQLTFRSRGFFANELLATSMLPMLRVPGDDPACTSGNQREDGENCRHKT